MRTPVLILGLALACGALATALLVAQRTARAAREEPLRAGERGPEPLPVEPQPARLPPMAGDTLAEAGLPTTRELPSPAPGELAIAEDLLAEFERARELGWVSDRRLAEFLAQVALERGDPQRALALLKREGSTNAGLYAVIAQALGTRGDRSGQAEALLAAIELAPNKAGLLDQLSQVAPELAIEQLELRIAAAPPPGPPMLRTRLAQVLAASGRSAEARRLLDGLLRENPGDEKALRVLAELDPSAVVAHVERLLESEPGEGTDRLFQILARTGGAASAQAVLERFAREGRELHPAQWGQVAALWLDAGESGRGTAALQQALALEHGDPDAWVQSLHELAPAELLRTLESRVAGDEARNDEFWGSLADAYWFAGRQADARAAWERARALDRDDGEWPMRLAALERGGDPFGD